MDIAFFKPYYWSIVNFKIGLTGMAKNFQSYE